jgi:hypothetical protein
MPVRDCSGSAAAEQWVTQPPRAAPARIAGSTDARDEIAEKLGMTLPAAPINECAYAVPQAKAIGEKRRPRAPCIVFVDGGRDCSFSGNDTTTSGIISLPMPNRTVSASSAEGRFR